MPASPCLSPFSLSAVDHYADETESDESRLVSLGQSTCFIPEKTGRKRQFLRLRPIFCEKERKNRFFSYIIIKKLLTNPKYPW